MNYMRMRIVRFFATVAVLGTLLTSLTACVEEEVPGALVGTWSGTSHSHSSRTLDGSMSFGYDSRGDFWFTVDEKGKVSGYAVVVYQPVADVSGINARIKRAQSLGISVIGLAGPLAGLVGNVANLTSFVAVEVDWSEPLPTRQGPITGTASPNGIALEWATEQTDPLPLTVSVRLVEKVESATEWTFPVDSPWPGLASNVSDDLPKVGDGPGHMVVSTGNDSSTSDDVKIAKAWSWAANRTG